MKLNFFKMQAQGNDYIFFDFIKQKIPDLDFEELAIVLSKRRFNIGADGIVLIEPSATADAKMRIFNADGSEGKMCGSALQSVVYHLSSASKHNKFCIETASGIKSGEVIKPTRKVKINLGQPVHSGKTEISGFEGDLIEIGNPHFVTFVENLESIDTKKTGQEIESSPHFPDGINVEFVEKLSTQQVKMKVWERGSGKTLSCGTGSCASIYAGIVNKVLSDSVKLISPGGEVYIDYDGTDIFLTGEVEFVFAGEIEI